MEFILIIILLIFIAASLMSKRAYLYSVCGLLIVINLAYFVFWKENLHCTQWTSFSKAFFDFKYHPEEIPPPVVYEPIAGTVIRLTYGAILLAVCFLPAFLILKNISNFKLRQIIIPVAVTGLTSVIAMFVPLDIIGERIHAYVGFAVVINLILLFIIMVFYGYGTGLGRMKNK